MTQAVYCSNNEGIVLASDSLALCEREGGQVERLAVRTLYPLTPHALVLAAGSAAGADMAAELAQWLQPRCLEELGDLVALSRDFLAESYARHLRACRGRIDGETASQRWLHFIIAGYSGVASSPFEAILLQSEAGELPFKESRLGRVFTLPRRMVQEGHITRQIARGCSLRELAESCLASLQAIAERNPESVAGPFRVAMVTERGMQFLED